MIMLYEERYISGVQDAESPKLQSTLKNLSFDKSQYQVTVQPAPHVISISA